MSRFIRSSLTGVLSLSRSAAIKARPGLAKYRYPACTGGRTLCSKITTEGFGMSDRDDASQQYGGYRNRLGLEKSPYLLQHANNPVDWYTWGREAFEKAKAENKPIFLSVGYSTCHWCHVMERESFEDEEIGKMLNDHFVPVKMDREERPDIDKVYMTFLQATEGSGGWPMSVWMTPDLKPFYGGTYFPPDDRYHNRPGFKTMLQNISKAWSESKEKIEEQGTVVLDALARHGSLSTPQEAPPAAEVAIKAHSMWAESFDKQMGGFSKAPKFPQPAILEFMFAMHGHNPGSGPGGEALNMALLTLDKMAKGGIHDHVGQGFHRYSTDEYWHVPHFEKMLYDQGQLASVYATSYQISHQEELASTLRDILLYVGRDLSDMEGGFYSAEDADSYPAHDATDKKEGAFCVWTQPEINTLLPEPLSGCEGKSLSDLFSEHYNVRSTGNVDPYKDPHDELKLKNVLTVRGCVEDTAETFGLEVATVSTLLAECRERLMAERRKRPAPHLDNKMITSWNALMISGYAKAAAVLDDQDYLERAALAAQFLERNMYSTTSGILLRSCYAGEDSVTQIETPIEGFVDDYAFLIKALLDLYEAGYHDNHLQWAERLQAKQDELFWDPEGGGYFTSGGLDQHVVLRLKEDQDGAEPSSNSVSAHNLLRLSNFLDTPSYRERAEQIFKAFALRLDKLPVALPGMLTALLFYHSTPKQIIVVGDPTADDTRRLLRCVHSHYLPNKVLMVAHGNTEGYLYQKVKVMESLTKVDGKATAYVCENFACSLPVNSVEGLEELLTQQ